MVTRLPREWYGTRATEQGQMSEQTAKGVGKRRKDAAILADALDLLDEREAQRFAFHIIKMTAAAMAGMIMLNTQMLMNGLLSTNHALHIIAGDAQMRWEVAISPQDTKEVLKIIGGATLLYGSESKKKVEERYESTEHMGQYTTGLLQTIQLELEWTQATIAVQLLATVQIPRTHQQQKRQAPMLNMPKYPKLSLDSNNAQAQPQQPQDARSGVRGRVVLESIGEGGRTSTEGQGGEHK
ncbi:MAG: hypothetical protein EZS28_020507 [Streblomastix strix]|uniref:Uncharacterized protein n=1 Tax=Streblomastix strix TaxID=222440 RepID=A0A5J4VNA2_9EUKA|nr:MAG: hypothetical protein EZS28_020507 [Streblomastix strix]